MKDKVKKKSEKKKEKKKKEKEDKEREKINNIAGGFNIFGDLDIRKIEGEKERENMYEKRLELIKNLYYRTR